MMKSEQERLKDAQRLKMDILANTGFEDAESLGSTIAYRTGGILIRAYLETSDFEFSWKDNTIAGQWDIDKRGDVGRMFRDWGTIGKISPGWNWMEWVSEFEAITGVKVERNTLPNYGFRAGIATDHNFTIGQDAAIFKGS